MRFQRAMAVKRVSGEHVTELLERLSSGRAESAWSEFLACYSPLMMHVIQRLETDHDRAAECFVYVCGALSDSGFRRLLSFRIDGPARFRTWLMAVVSNLCIDWHRGQQGRVRPFRSVERLPELDQQVFRCMYVRGMSRASCVETLRPRFPGLVEATVAEISARLFALLSPRQRWQLSVRSPALNPIPCGASAEDDDPGWELEAPGPGPDELATEAQEERQLRDALSRLPAEQRLLLRLRYEQNLTLAEVACLTGQPDPFRANRRIQAALHALRDLMGAPRSGPDRKNR